MAKETHGIESGVPQQGIDTRPGGADKLSNPYAPRTDVAPDAQHPKGTESWAAQHKGQPVLQQHCEFWDRDGDNIIWPHDTYIGLRDLGWNIFLALFAVTVIHSGFSYFTLPASFWYFPDPFFRLYLGSMHRAHHGSSTGVYDREGRFVPAQFEGIFDRYDKDHKGGLTWREAVSLGHGSRQVADPFGWFAEAFEWLATYIMLWPEDGVMKKDDIRRIYDGSLFYDIREKRAKEGKKAHPFKNT